MEMISNKILGRLNLGSLIVNCILLSINVIQHKVFISAYCIFWIGLSIWWFESQIFQKEDTSG